MSTPQRSESIVVKKFGGSSLSSLEKIRHVARKIVAAHARGRRVVVVVSAMGSTTSDLVEQARNVSPTPPPRELDMLLSSGERMSMALMAMAVEREGVPAVSLTGPQSGILTDGEHANAAILSVQPARVHAELAAGRVVIVAGYQGASPAGEVTTLGRGGSDLTAAALAHALGAYACEIYSDVPGVYTADPRAVADAAHLACVDADLMAEYAACGARVLQSSCLELAVRESVELRAFATFGDETHTRISRDAGLRYSGADRGARLGVVGIASRERRLHVRGAPAGESAREALLETFRRHRAVPEEWSALGDATVDFLLGTENVTDIDALASDVAAQAGGRSVVTRDVASISVVADLSKQPELTDRVDAVLRDAGVDVLWRDERPLSVTRAVEGSRCVTALRALHAALVGGSAVTDESASREASTGSQPASAQRRPFGGVTFRQPEQADGAAVWELARASGTLDANSPYVYLMWCDHFAETSVVAERDGEIVAFVCGFAPAATPDVLFVWQIAVDDRMRGEGVAMRMLQDILRRRPATRFVEATVTPSNGASRKLFRSLARRLSCECGEETYLRADDFPAGAAHEPERLLRVGPIRRVPGSVTATQTTTSTGAAVATRDVGVGASKSEDVVTPPADTEETMMQIFEELESEVRSYIRSFPTVFVRAKGHTVYDEDGRSYLDFFAGAGALNYGHNHDRLKQRVIEYLMGDGIVHSLDMATAAKRALMERMRDTILAPRGLSYKMMFPGPTGTNCVEAALKLARKATGRSTVFGFQGAFHGMTLGSLSITANARKRAGAGVDLEHAELLPFCGETRKGQSSIRVLEQTLAARAGTDALPAAVVLETVQCEGGVRVATDTWLREVAATCKRHGVLLVVDDIQAGCGRTGSFFSFEPAGLSPDIVCLSKSLSGLGVPMSLVLLREDLDVFDPGEHNGTFRGHNLAFVSATEALRFWEDDALATAVARRAAFMRERLAKIAHAHPEAKATLCGRGMVQGLAMGVPGLASAVARECFERGLLIETAGPEDEVLKLLPPLTIEDAALERGLDIIEQGLCAGLERCDADAAA